MIRILQITIVLFWLGTTSWLAWTVWAPSGSGFTEMSEEEVLDTFFKWNQSDSFSIIDSGRRIGQATVSAREGEVTEDGEIIMRAFSVTGSLFEDARFLDDPEAITLSWRVSFEFDPVMPDKMTSAQMTVRVPKQKLNVIVSLTEDPKLLRARAKLQDAVIFEYKGDPSEMPEVPDSLLSGLAAGFIGDIDNLEENFKPGISAKRGTRTFGGRDLPVFLLEIKPSPNQPEIRVYLTQAGEPIKVETDFGIEAVSDVLAPLESFRRKSKD